MTTGAFTLRTIWIVVPMAYGHVIPTTRTATSLREHGLRVVYVLVAFAEEIEVHADIGRLLEYLGFEHYLMELPWPEVPLTRQDGDRHTRSHLKEVAEDWGRRMADSWQQLAEAVGCSDDPAIMYDSFFPQAGFVARALRVPAGVLYSDLPNRVDLHAPPMNSGAVPSGPLWRLRLLTAWTWYLAGSLHRSLTSRASDSIRRGFAYSIDSFVDLAGSVVKPRRCLHQDLPRIHDASEFVFTSPALDFSRRRSRRLNRMGLLIEYNRPYTEFAWDAIDPDKKLVYCALGTERLDNGIYEHVLQSVAEAVAGLEECQLVLVVGKSPVPSQVAEGVVVCEHAPQVDIIGRCDAVVTHGGFNTIKEAAAAGVPSVVVPAAGKITDARRNGALVEYLGLGIALTDPQLKITEIRRAIRSALHDEGMTDRCRAFAHASSSAERADTERCAPAVLKGLVSCR